MDGFTINADKTLLDFDVIYDFIANSYWAKDIPISVMQAAIDNALCFGVYQTNEQQGVIKQVGFARMITDKATFAYLADVFILPDFRGRGLSKQLMQYIFAYPDLQGLRKIMLTTKDAHGLYKQFGFSQLEQPDMILQIARPDIYQQKSHG